MDEFNFALEHRLSQTFKVTATGIFRDWRNFVNSTLNNAVWQPISANNGLTGQPYTVYQWANRTDVPEFTISNIDAVTYHLTDGSTVHVAEGGTDVSRCDVRAAAGPQGSLAGAGVLRVVED